MLFVPCAYASRPSIVHRCGMAEFFSRTTEAKGRSTDQVCGEAVASTSGRPSGSELPLPEARSAAREGTPNSDQKVAMGADRTTSATAASHPPMDKQRLPARATALLLQADTSGARPLPEHALERGSRVLPWAAAGHRR